MSELALMLLLTGSQPPHPPSLRVVGPGGTVRQFDPWGDDSIRARVVPGKGVKIHEVCVRGVFAHNIERQVMCGCPHCVSLRWTLVAARRKCALGWASILARAHTHPRARALILLCEAPPENIMVNVNTTAVAGRSLHHLETVSVPLCHRAGCTRRWPAG